jgi:hypothetical protein
MPGNTMRHSSSRRLAASANDRRSSTLDAIGSENCKHLTVADRFAEAPLKGERGGWDLIKTVVKDTIREVL